MGRVAVVASARRQGFALALARAAEEAARAAGAQLMKLHAQAYIRGMYEQLGYEAIRDVDYEDEGQPHVWMRSCCNRSRQLRLGQPASRWMLVRGA